MLVNAEERRLRSGWRLLCFGALYVVLLVVTQVALSALLSGAALPPWSVQMLDSGAYLLATLVAVWIARHLLDRRSVGGLGLRLRRGWRSDLLFGIVLGAVLMTAVFVAHWRMGWTVVTELAWQKGDLGQVFLQACVYVVLCGVVAVNEELVNRGYILQNLEDRLPQKVATVVSSLLFGLLHAGNPNASWYSTLAIFLAGLFLASGYLVTRSLWLPIGIHFSWNLFQGTIFGFAVSGTSGFHLIEHQVSGPRWLTGGAFGPEAGLTGIAAMAVGTAFVLLWGRFRHRWTVSDSL